MIEELLKQMKLEYVETLPEKCERISSLLASESRDELETEFHKMKGTGKTYGLGEVSVLGEVVEKICRDQGHLLQDSIPQAIKILLEIYSNQKQGRTYVIEDSPDFQNLKTQYASLSKG